jgi:hypothetical protein
MRQHLVTRLESLESRLALAGVFTFLDSDGDFATVRSTQGTDIDLSSAISLSPAGVGFQLSRVDLSLPVFAGTRLRITATASGGDGFVHVGEVVTPHDLRAVVVGGDLARITVGDVDPATRALNRLAVDSIGRFGLSTGAPDTTSVIAGPLGSLEVAGDVVGASLGVSGRIDKAAIGGSVLGVNAFDGIAASAIGTLTITGVISGGPAFASGQIAANSGPIRTLRVGGIAGGGGDVSGTITSAGAMEDVRIGGSIAGGGGLSSGRLFAGGAGIRNLVVRGSIFGGSNDDSGGVQTGGRIGSARIDGSIVGGSGLRSGRVDAVQGIGSLRIGQDIAGGTQSLSGSVASNGRIGRLEVRSVLSDTGLYGGSVNAANIGTMIVRGDLAGSPARPAVISATGVTGRAIGSLTIHGNVAGALVLGGYDGGVPVHGAARIGSVQVRGFMLASSIAAGVSNVTAGQFGTLGDFGIGGVTASRIGSVTVRGLASGNGVPTDAFGVVAGAFGRVRVGGTTFATPPGSITSPAGDNFAIHRL